MLDPSAARLVTDTAGPLVNDTTEFGLNTRPAGAVIVISSPATTSVILDSAAPRFFGVT